MGWTIVEGGLYRRGACPEWASGLSLAAEQSIDMGSRNMDMGFYKWHSFVQGMFRMGKWAFPCS